MPTIQISEQAYRHLTYIMGMYKDNPDFRKQQYGNEPLSKIRLNVVETALYTELNSTEHFLEEFKEERDEEE